MHLPGKLTIAHPHSAGHEYIALQVEDATSGLEFLEVRLSPEAFANAITGLSHQACTLELHGLAHLGKRRELKRERVPYTPVYGEDEAPAKAQALTPFEVDGWVGTKADLGNHHKGSARDGYLVTFTRFVEP